MNIKGLDHLLTFVEGHSDSTFSNFFFAMPTEAKFFVEPPCDEGMKMNINGLCNMTKMAALPIHGEKLVLNVFFSGTKRLMT